MASITLNRIVKTYDDGFTASISTSPTGSS